MNSFEIKHYVTFSDEFRDLFKQQRYEHYVYLILIRSKRLFCGRSFCRNEKQSDGECDYIDDLGNKYDAKLIFDKEQGALLGERQNDILRWFESLRDESIEFFEKCISKRDLSGIVSTKLYGIVKDRICTLKEDENGILFIPYPIVDDFEGGFYLQFATDFISAISERLVEEGIVGERRLYYIYPSMVVNNYCLRSIDGDREFIDVPELDKYIFFTTCQ